MAPLEHQLGAAPAEAGAFGTRADREARHVDEGDDGQAESVAERDEMRTLVAGVAVDHAAEPQRLVGHEADRPSAQPRQCRHHVAGKRRLQLEQRAGIGQLAQDLAHVVGLAGRDRHEVEQRVGRTGERPRVGGRLLRCPRIGRQIGEKASRRRESIFLAFDAEIGETLAVDLHVGAPQLLRVDLLAGRRLDQGRARDAHGRQAAHHHDEVGHAGIVGRAGEARAKHQRHHRHPARGAGEVVEGGVGVGEVPRILAVLDAMAATVQDHDQR